MGGRDLSCPHCPGLAPPRDGRREASSAIVRCHWEISVSQMLHSNWGTDGLSRFAGDDKWTLALLPWSLGLVVAPARASEVPRSPHHKRPHHRSGHLARTHTGHSVEALACKLPRCQPPKQQAGEIHVEVVCQSETREGEFTPSVPRLRRHQQPC